MGDRSCQGGGLEPRMYRVAGLRVRELKAEHISRLLAHAGTPEAHASRSKRPEASRQRGRNSRGPFD
jgi:hypothetical protein